MPKPKPKPKPKLFVGSASEARLQAEGFIAKLRAVAEPVPWWLAPDFAPMSGTLEALIASAQVYDYGLFLLTPDDSITSRKKKGHSARDNVLFELGLFLGELGRDRVFAVMQDGPSRKKAKVPSDLLGITIPRFAAPTARTHVDTVTSACRILRQAVQEHGFRDLNFNLVDGWSYLDESKRFRMVLSERLMADSFHRLRGRQMALVVRRYNDAIDRDSDTTVVIGSARIVPKKPQRIEMEVEVQSLLPLQGDPRLDGYLFLLPADVTLTNVCSIDDILAIGGRLIEARGRSITHALQEEE